VPLVVVPLLLVVAVPLLVVALLLLLAPLLLVVVPLPLLLVVAVPLLVVALLSRCRRRRLWWRWSAAPPQPWVAEEEEVGVRVGAQEQTQV
jgi:hypothetical protein